MLGDLLVLAPSGLGRMDDLYRELGALGWRTTLREVPEPRHLLLGARIRSLRPARTARFRAFARNTGRILRTERAFEDRSRTARRFVERERPDCVLQVSGMYSPAGPPPNVPYAVFCDCTVKLGEGVPFSAVDFPSPEVARAWYARERALYRGAGAVLTASDHVRRSVIQDYGVAPERVVTVGEGTNVRAEHLAEPEKGPPRILFVGYEFERKGGPVLLEAFRRVAAEVDGAELVIAGPQRIDGPLPPGVRLVGRTPLHELHRLYAESTVFALPSLFEPFGLVLLEAMEHGLPCVGAHRDAIPEIVVDGETGRLVPPGNAEALAEALVWLLRRRDEAHGMGRAGRRRVRQRFTWSAVALRVNGCLQKILSEPVEPGFHQGEGRPPSIRPGLEGAPVNRAGRVT